MTCTGFLKYNQHGPGDNQGRWSRKAIEVTYNQHGRGDNQGRWSRKAIEVTYNQHSQGDNQGRWSRKAIEMTSTGLLSIISMAWVTTRREGEKKI